MIFYQLLPTTSVGNEEGQQLRVQILILEFKGLMVLASMILQFLSGGAYGHSVSGTRTFFPMTLT